MNREELEIKLEKMLKDMRNIKNKVNDIYQLNTLKSFAGDIYYMLEDCKNGIYSYDLNYYVINKYTIINKWFKKFEKELGE